MNRLGLTVLFGLAACSSPPRAPSYFRAHMDEAAKVIVDCEAGSHRGAECANASQAIEQANGAARLGQYRQVF